MGKRILSKSEPLKQDFFNGKSECLYEAEFWTAESMGMEPVGLRQTHPGFPQEQC